MHRVAGGRPPTVPKALTVPAHAQPRSTFTPWPNPAGRFGYVRRAATRGRQLPGSTFRHFPPGCRTVALPGCQCVAPRRQPIRLRLRSGAFGYVQRPTTRGRQQQAPETPAAPFNLYSRYPKSKIISFADKTKINGI